MSYTLLSKQKHKAIKEHECIWCGENILKGIEYYKTAGIFDGEFRHEKWHIECRVAAEEDYDWQDEIFDPYSFKRGTAEEK